MQDKQRAFIMTATYTDKGVSVQVFDAEDQTFPPSAIAEAEGENLPNAAANAFSTLEEESESGQEESTPTA